MSPTVVLTWPGLRSDLCNMYDEVSVFPFRLPYVFCLSFAYCASRAVEDIRRDDPMHVN
jgi:hypothetical protein